MINKARFEIIIRNILILFGLIFLYAWVGSIVYAGLSRLFFVNREINTSSIFGGNLYILYVSLPNIIFFFVLGLLVPITIKKETMIWATIIGFSLLLYSRFITKIIHVQIPQAIHSHFSIYAPFAVIVPAFILGSFLTFQLLRGKKS